MAPGLLVDKDKGSADLLSTKILYGIQSVVDSGQGDRLAGWRADGIIILMIANKWQPKAGFVPGRPCKWFPNLPPKVLRRGSRQSWDQVIFKNQKSSAACEVFYKG